MTILEHTCKKVETFLKEEFKDSCKKLENDFFTIKHGSAMVHIFIEEYEHDECLVRSRAYVVSNAAFSYELFKKILLMNSEDLLFGKFGIDKNGYIILDYVMLGTTLDKQELIKTVKEISRTADDMDDILVKEFGGKKAIDTFIEKNF